MSFVYLISPNILPGPNSASTSSLPLFPTTSTMPWFTMYISLPISPYREQSNTQAIITCKHELSHYIPPSCEVKVYVNLTRDKISPRRK